MPHKMNYKSALLFLGFLYFAYVLYDQPPPNFITCLKDQTYSINTVDDLKNLFHKMECVFQGGLTPSLVPSGALLADVISLGNKRFLENFGPSKWGGRYISPPCPCKNTTSTKLHLGWIWLFGRVVSFPFEAFISPVTDAAQIGHQVLSYNQKPSLIFLYDLSNLTLKCPELQPDDIKRSPVRKNLYPNHRRMDELRVVGRQSDGGAILLGRTFFLDSFDDPVIFKPIAFYTLISYDKELNPEFTAGQSLPPLDQEMSHVVLNRGDVLRTLFAADDLTRHPLRTFPRILQEYKMHASSAGNCLSEIFWDLVHPGEESEIIKAAFNNLPVGVKQPN